MSREHRLLGVRDLSTSAYVLRLEREGMDFQPGQYVNLGEYGSTNTREYSIYSSPSDPFLEVIIKEIQGGSVSRQLRRLAAGARLQCEGPFGFFTISPDQSRRRLLFVATGTGISPFHSFVRSMPGLDYRLLHGVRSESECYDRESYPPERYQACVSGADPGNEFAGRVTDYLNTNPVALGTRCYLCGNSNMIFEAFDVLKQQGVGSEDLAAEVYF